MDCRASSFTQRMTAPFSVGSSTYRSDLILQTASQTSLDLIIWKDGTRVEYGATGISQQLETSGDHLQVQLSGAYQTQEDGSARAAGFPGSGNFSARLNLDCSTQSVVTEELTLSD
jgi:hypothetical protein